MDNFAEWLPKILMFASIIGNLLVSLLVFIKARNAQKIVNKSYDLLNKNRESQKKYEKEVLEPMAKTLCDKCGKEIPVRECVQYTALNAKEYDVCTDCAAELKSLDNKVSDLWKQVDEYSAKIAELKEQIKAITGE